MMWFLVKKKSGVCAVQYASVIMFTRAIGREKSGVSNFEIRESDRKIFSYYMVTGRWVRTRETTLVDFGHVGEISSK